MEMNLITVARKTFTRFKLSLKEYNDPTSPYKRILNKYGVTNPTKKSSRFIYFEMEGDWINKR